MPRFVANRFAVPAGSTASGTFVPASTPTQRRTVPSPPQAKTSSAPASSARSTCAGAFLALGTSYQSGSSTPAVASARRSAGNPPSSVFAACATTATFMTTGCGRREVDRARVRLGACASAATPAARHANSSTSTAPMPISAPAATSSGWCMPRYMREDATKTGSRRAIAQAATRQLRFGNADVSSNTRPQ